MVQEKAITKYGPMKCTFTDIIRTNDFSNKDSKTVEAVKYELKASDVVSIFFFSFLFLFI